MRRATLTLLVAALVAAPSTARAAEVKVGKACYAEGDTIEVSGTGFSAEGPVALALARGTTPLHFSLDPLASPQGVVAGEFKLEGETNWFRRSETRFPLTVTLRDQRFPEVQASTTLPFSRWNVMVDGVAQGAIYPHLRTRIRAVGWTHAIGDTLYAHYVRRGRRFHTLRVGVIRGPCGDVSRTLPRGFPFRPVAPGLWEVFFNTSRTRHSASPYVEAGGATVRRRLLR